MSVTGKKPETITIKGAANGLLIRIREDAPGSFAEHLTELEERLQNGERFFRNAKATVEIGQRVLTAEDLEKMLNLLKQHEVVFELLVAGATETRKLAKENGLSYKFPNGQTTRPPKPVADSSGVLPFDSAEALFVKRTLRSGQILQHHSDVIVFGDVNPGAEIIAGGNVVVWGSVRGKIQAGTLNDAAIICALSLRPTQLGIGKVVAMANPDSLGDPENGPEIASLKDEDIVVESWMPKKARF